jgi:hypothetical protein
MEIEMKTQNVYEDFKASFEKQNFILTKPLIKTLHEENPCVS